LMFSLTKGDDSYRVLPLKSKYPQGAEKVLIQQATKREVPRGGLPSDAGVLVLNVTTVSALGKYIATGMPLTTKRLTVDGSCVNTPKNVLAIIGTSLGTVLNFCGGLKEGTGKIIT
ncbi:MAG: SLBB domain-containing protein, partial [Ruthenibacterium sp.]